MGSIIVRCTSNLGYLMIVVVVVELMEAEVRGAYGCASMGSVRDMYI